MNRFILIICFSLIGHGSLAASFEVRGMKTPKSTVFDSQTGMYYVSNMEGKSNGRDAKGFISKIRQDGEMIDYYFIGSGKNGVVLDAPQGLSIQGNNLYIVDITRVLRFNKNSGKVLGLIDLRGLGAILLSDSALDDEGKLFVCDRPGNAIYHIDPEKSFQVSQVIKGGKLRQPNGLVYDPHFKRLIITSWEKGAIWALSNDGNIIALFKDNSLKNLNGILFDRAGNLIFSSFTGGKIYRLKNFSTLEILRENIVTPADISIDISHNQILVPSPKGNIVFSLSLN